MDYPEMADILDNQKVRILDAQALLRGYFQVDQITLEHLRHDGDWSDAIERLLLHRPDGACAMVHHTERNTCLFVRQFRVGACVKENGWLTELAAGLVDPGESPEDACRREVEEELGYRPRELTKLATFFTSPGIISERVHVFYIAVTENDKVNEGGGLQDEHEDLEIIEVPVEEMKQYFEEKPARDGKTLVGLLLFEQFMTGTENHAENSRSAE